MKSRVFVYETLKNPDVMSKVLGRTLNHTVAHAVNEKKVPILIKGHGLYYTLRPSAKHLTQGYVFDVTEGELQKLDDWEDRYVRRPVELDDGDMAYAYILENTYAKGPA